MLHRLLLACRLLVMTVMNHLSPTQLASYFHKHCDLFLNLSFQRTISAATHQPVSTLVEGHFQRGNAWESRLFDTLEARGQLIRLPAGLVPAASIESVLLRALPEEQFEVFIAGLEFEAPTFEAEYAAHGQKPVKFGITKPDLIWLRREGDSIFWEVIDAKASKTVQVSAHSMYTVCL